MEESSTVVWATLIVDNTTVIIRTALGRAVQFDEVISRMVERGAVVESGALHHWIATFHIRTVHFDTGFCGSACNQETLGTGMHTASTRRNATLSIRTRLCITNSSFLSRLG